MCALHMEHINCEAMNSTTGSGFNITDKSEILIGRSIGNTVKVLNYYESIGHTVKVLNNFDRVNQVFETAV